MAKKSVDNNQDQQNEQDKAGEQAAPVKEGHYARQERERQEKEEAEKQEREKGV